MQRYTPGNVGGGVFYDVDPIQLPPQAWSTASNFYFENGAAKRVDGYSLYGAATGTPIFAIPVLASPNYFWVYANDAGNVYGTDGTTTNLLNPSDTADFFSTIPNKWNGGVLGGVLILNNGVDDPHYWESASLTSNLTALTNWPASTTTKVIRPHRDLLIALNTTETGTAFPQRMRWSTSAPSGSLPDSWDAADPTKRAGFYDFAQTDGEIVDGASLRDSFIVYKSDSVWRAQWIGGNAVFAFTEISRDTGLLSTNCIAEYKGVQFALMQGDVVMCDGNRIESIIDKKNREYLFNNIDPDNFDSVFVSIDVANSQLMVCYPKQGSDYPDSAMLYDIKQGSWGHRDLPSLRHIANGIVDPGTSQLVDDYSDVVDTFDGFVDALAFNPPEVSQMWVSNDGNLYKGNDGSTANGTVISSLLVKQDVPLTGSIDYRTMVTRVIPSISGTTGDTVNVSIGVSEGFSQPIMWQTSTYTIGTDYKCDFRTSGRLVAIRFTGNTQYDVTNYEIQYAKRGER
ncbi:MAG: hypothetical protein AAF434_17200 [Pseudomonadota bacterium]